MKKYIVLILMIIVIITMTAISIIFKNKKEDTSNIRTIKLNEVTRSVFYAPQYIAINKNFFEKRNIKVELTTGQGADKVMTSILTDQCDIGFAGPEAAIYVYNEGKEDYTQVFAQLTKRDGSFLVSKTKQENFNWKNLKNTTIIPGRKGGVPYMTLEYVLKKNGLNPSKDLMLDDSIKFDLMAGAFTGGNAQYVTLFEPTASLTEKAGKGYIVASVGEEAGEIPYTAYFAKKSYINENQEVIQDFTDAVYEGEQWVKSHSAKEIAEVIIEFFPDTDLELLETVIQRYKDIDVWSETPVLKQDSFDLLQTVMIEAGELKNKVPYDEVVNNKFANGVNK